MAIQNEGEFRNAMGCSWMTLETFISTYGYLALWAGTFWEGETILDLFLARKGG
jgi:hypothetical protein